MINKENKNSAGKGLQKLPFSDTPLLILEAEDTYSLDHLRNCQGWRLLKTKTVKEIEEWLEKQPEHIEKDMRRRLRLLFAQARQMRKQSAPQSL